MKNLYILVLILLMGCNSKTHNPKPLGSNEHSMNIPGTQITTYYFIRHAEKDTSDPTDRDPELTQQGYDRAEKWAAVFKEVSFDLVYSTNYKRTRSTARRIADSQEKDIKIYDANKLNDNDFTAVTKGKTILIVGHSNTNPLFVNSIIGEEKFKDIPETEYGSLFIVTFFPNGSSNTQVLYIN